MIRGGSLLEILGASGSCGVRGRPFVQQSSLERNRSRSNLIELEHDRNRRRKPMKYEGWSKSIELDQTLTPNSAARDGGRSDEKILEQKVTKVTKGRG